MRVRLATPRDVPGVAELSRACIAEMRRRGIEQWDDLYPTEATFLADARAGALFILPGADEIPDGAFTIDDRPSPEYAAVAWTIRADRVAIVHRLMVHPRRQGEGLSRALMADAERRAAALGFHAIRLDAFALNPAALRLYRGLGYHDAGRVMLRKGEFHCFEKAL